MKEALEQLFKQPYDEILKSRPELGEAQMAEALARSLPEHKRRLEITDEFSALCSGTTIEGRVIKVNLTCVNTIIDSRRTSVLVTHNLHIIAIHSGQV